MTKLSDLPEELVQEILSRVPVSSLIPVRSTCKPWRAFSKTQIVGQRSEDAMNKTSQQFREFTLFDSKLCFLKFNLEGIRNEEDEFINPTMKQVSVFDEFNVSQVNHCDGLLLCITKEQDNNPRVMVWNPYLGQTRWIKPITKFHKLDGFALGFDDKGNHKIMRFDFKRGRSVDVYDFSSHSWRVLDIRPDSNGLFYHTGVSFKGNAYFFHRDHTEVETEEPGTMDVADIFFDLVCFDFTTERFGPRLPLPFNRPYPSFETLTLSSVRNDKLSVLYRHNPRFDVMEIWVLTKIEPNAVSWSKFLSVDLTLFSGFPDDFEAKRFFIDEDKKVAIVVIQDPFGPPFKTRACIIGEDGYFKSVNIRESENGSDRYLHHACSPYVPSLVQL